MYAVINKSGCCERKGNVQIRMDFYLEPGDARYEERYVQVPDIPFDAIWPKESDKLQEWLDSFPKKWQNNPFHCHFIYVSPDITDIEINEKMAKHLADFYNAWSDRKDIIEGWDINTQIKPIVYKDLAKIQACKDRLTSLDTDASVRIN